MNKLSGLLLTIALMSNIPAHAVRMPSKDVFQKALYTSAVGTTALYYFTKKPLSEKELAKLKPIEQEESYVTLLMRIVKELAIGQPSKPKELESVDVKTGIAKYRKFPATGVVGLSHKWTKKLVIPVVTCGIALEKTKEAVKGGINWYRDGIDLDKLLK